jgi:hypothetical protein
MPHSIKFLLSDEQAKKRLARLDGKVRSGRGNKCVIHVEVPQTALEWPLDHRNMIEFDAISPTTAMKLGKRWLSHHGAKTFAIRRIRDDGSLSAPLGIYDAIDFMEEGEVW